MSSKFKLDDYLLDASDFLQDYEIYSEKTKRFYHLQKGVLNNTSQKVKIYSRTVNPGQSNFKSISHRLKLLFEGFNDGYILADNIFLDKKFHSQNYELYIIEPDFSDNSGKYQQLDIYLKKNPTQSLKKQIFKNLLIIIKKLHESGLAHLSLNPKNIWIEDETLVYMRPFMIDLFEINEKVNKSCLNNKNCSFYRSPEETFISDYISKSKNYSFLIKCDLWALGCIFSELFLPNLRYPLFYTKDAEEKLFKFFEVLQFPEKKEIPFLDENYYNEIERILKKKPKNSTQDKNLLTFLKKTMLLEGKIILGFLIFDPKKRQDCKTLLISDFFQNSALSSDEKNKISKRLFSSSKSKKTKQFSRDDYFEKEIPLSEEFELSEEESFEKMNKIIIKKKTEYESFSENLDECIDEKNNSFLTNNSQSDDFLNSPQFKTPQIDKKFISLQKNSDDNKKIKQNPKIFSSKSLFLTNKEPIESTNITNLTNISKYKENKEIKESNSNLANKMKFKEKKIWFEIKLLKVFVFQGIKHSEISVQLARKTRNSVIQQDLINYKRFDGRNNLFEMNAIQTKKITKSDIKSMKSDENLLINFNCRWEKTSQLLGFIEIPLLELYKTLKETSKKKEFTIFSEWFNILSFHKDEQLFVIGKAKIEIQLKPEKTEDLLDSFMQKSSKKEKITGLSQFYGKLYERSNFCNNMDKNSNKKKLSEIMTEMDELNSKLLQKKSKYLYEKKEEFYETRTNEKEFDKIINRLQNILFKD